MSNTEEAEKGYKDLYNKLITDFRKKETEEKMTILEKSIIGAKNIIDNPVYISDFFPKKPEVIKEGKRVDLIEDCGHLYLMHKTINKPFNIELDKKNIDSVFDFLESDVEVP